MTRGRGLVTGLTILVIAVVALAGVLGGGPDDGAARTRATGETPGLTESDDTTDVADAGNEPSPSDAAPTTGSPPPPSQTAPAPPAGAAADPTTSSTEPPSSEGTEPSNPFAPPAPTTTPTLTAPVIPPADSIDSLCGSTEFLKSLVAIFVLPGYSAANDVSAIRAAIDAYAAVAPAEVEQHMALVAATAHETLSIAEAAGWNAADPAVRARYESLVTNAPEHAAFFASLSRVATFEANNCGGVAS